MADANPRSATRPSNCATKYGMIRVMRVNELMQAAVDARRVAQRSLASAVREARQENWSWDRISAALGGAPNGETLRRTFGGEQTE